MDFRYPSRGPESHSIVIGLLVIGAMIVCLTATTTYLSTRAINAAQDAIAQQRLAAMEAEITSIRQYTWAIAGVLGISLAALLLGTVVLITNARTRHQGEALNAQLELARKAAGNMRERCRQLERINRALTYDLAQEKTRVDVPKMPPKPNGLPPSACAACNRELRPVISRDTRALTPTKQL